MFPRNTVTFLHGSRVPWAVGGGIRQGWGLLKLITTLRASAASSERPPRYRGVTVPSSAEPYLLHTVPMLLEEGFPSSPDP